MGDTTRDTKTRNVKIHDNFSAEECFRYKCSVQWLWYFTCLHWPAGRDHMLTIEYSSEFLKKFSIKWEDKSSNPIWLKIDLIPPQHDFIIFLMFFWVSLKFRLWTMRYRYHIAPTRWPLWRHMKCQNDWIPLTMWHGSLTHLKLFSR